MMSAICFKIILGRDLAERGERKQDWQNVHMLKLANGYVRVHELFSSLCIFLKIVYNKN